MHYLGVNKQAKDLQPGDCVLYNINALPSEIEQVIPGTKQTVVDLVNGDFFVFRNDSLVKLYAKDPNEQEPAPRYHEYQDVWNDDDIDWNDSFEELRT